MPRHGSTVWVDRLLARTLARVAVAVVASVTDVWESAADFEAFAKDRLLPVVKGELGMTGDPDVEIHPLQSVFLAAAANA